MATFSKLFLGVQNKANLLIEVKDQLLPILKQDLIATRFPFNKINHYLQDLCDCVEMANGLDPLQGGLYFDQMIDKELL